MNEPRQFQHKATGQIVTATRLPDDNGYDWDVSGVAMLSGQMMDAKFIDNFEPIPSPTKPTRGAVEAALAVSQAIEAYIAGGDSGSLTHEAVAALIEKHTGVGIFREALEEILLKGSKGGPQERAPRQGLVNIAVNALALARRNGTATDKEG